jgi:hypothetical protein
MTGGLIQLAAYGLQDLYLTSEPQITFFKIIYKRHTSFAIESVIQEFNVRPNFGDRASVTVGNIGDLIGKTYLFVTLPSVPEFINAETGLKHDFNVFAWTKRVGYSLIKRVEIEIGGQLIDRQYGDWMNIWTELTQRYNKRSLDKMLGDDELLTGFTNGKQSYNLYIPLEFWFSRNHNMALPLIALRYSKVKIHVEFNRANECFVIGPTHYIDVEDPIVHFEKFEYIQQTVNNVTSNGIFVHFDTELRRLYYIKVNNKFLATPEDAFFDYTISGVISGGMTTPKKENLTEEIRIHVKLPSEISITKAHLLVDYYYLDTEERLKFYKSNHEYLIDVLQFESEKPVNNNNFEVRLGFNHPTKEIFWQTQFNFIKNGFINDKFNYTNNFDKTKGANNTKEAVILLNGNEAFKDQVGEYFNRVQVYQKHSNSPSEGINVYCFCLNPEKIQPSGAINFSRLDEIKLRLTLDRNFSYTNPGTMRVYALSYNVLRIIDGIGGLAFSD